LNGENNIRGTIRSGESVTFPEPGNDPIDEIYRGAADANAFKPAPVHDCSA
jgi:hypothetical protein